MADGLRLTTRLLLTVRREERMARAIMEDARVRSLPTVGVAASAWLGRLLPARMYLTNRLWDRCRG